MAKARSLDATHLESGMSRKTDILLHEGASVAATRMRYPLLSGPSGANHDEFRITSPGLIFSSCPFGCNIHLSQVAALSPHSGSEDRHSLSLPGFECCIM